MNYSSNFFKLSEISSNLLTSIDLSEGVEFELTFIERDFLLTIFLAKSNE